MTSWADHHRDEFADLDLLEEPSDVGRKLEVGAFVLGDPFDTKLRLLSEDYLRRAWARLEEALRRHALALDDLSWGCVHCGTRLPGMLPSPSDFVGFTSRRILELDWEGPTYERMDEELGGGAPALRCTALWRSLKWRIAPTDATRALRLIEALSTDELSAWNPEFLARDHRAASTEPWLEVAYAIRDGDQARLDRAVAEAKAAYSPAGFRIVVRANLACIRNRGLPLTMPGVA